MKYKTVFYTTIRAEVHHDIEFAGKGDAMAQIVEQGLLDYADAVLGEGSFEGDMRVTSVEVVTDEVQDYNLAPDEDYADDDEDEEDAASAISDAETGGGSVGGECD